MSNPPTFKPIPPLSIPETVRYLKVAYGLTVTRQTVYNWVRNGKRGIKLPAKKSVRSTLIERGHLDAFVAAYH